MAESQRKKELFLAALELPSTQQREVFLASACGSDEELKRQVEALLRAHAAGDSFLEKPAAVLGQTVGEPQVQEIPHEGPGTRIGPYKLLEPIGEGGMGSVWMAEQQQPVRRLVALKLIKEGMDSGRVIARFEAERQALALMDHPNIAKVFDAGTTESGRPYFVMELVRGISITKYCDERRLTLRQRLELLIPVCQAVQHAHQKGIIHRDLKPSNVLIALYDGQAVPKVIDFGIAKATGQQLTDRTLVTGFGAIVGTLEYMSPEQAEPNQLDIDTRSDVYSLGVLLYELLTGTTPLDRRRLHNAAIWELLRLIREEEPSRPSTRLSSSNELPMLSAQRQLEPGKLTRLVRGELDWIVMKALEKDRNRRYETAAGLARDVERYLKDELVEARPPSIGYRLGKTMRKHRGPVLAAALVLLTLLGGVIGTTLAMLRAWQAEVTTREAKDTIQANLLVVEGLHDKANRALEQTEVEWKRAENEKNVANLARQQTEVQKQETENQLARAESQLYVSQVLEADHFFRSGDWFRCRQALDECRWDLRGPEHGYLVKELKQKAANKVFVHHQCLILSIALSGDGKRLVSGGTSGLQNEIKVWDVASGKEIASLPVHQYGPHPITRVTALTLSADGEQLYGALGGGAIKVWDLRTGKVTQTLSAQTGEVTSMIVQSDGKRLYSASADHTIKVWDLDTGKETFTLKGHGGVVTSIVLSSDSQRLYSASYDQTIKVWDLKEGKEITTLRGHDAHVRALALSPDGKRLFSGSSDGMIKAWNLDTAKETTSWRGHPYGLTSLALSNDGKRLISAASDESIKVWDLEGGKEPVILGWNLGGSHYGLVLSADGKRLFSANGNRFIRCWDLEADQGVDSWRGHTDAVQCMILSNDGKRLFTGSRDNTIKVWDQETHKEIFTLRGHRRWVNSLAVSGDGKRLYSGSQDMTVKVWDLDTGKEISTWHGPKSAISCLALTKDGKRLYCGSHLIIAWNPESGKEEFTLRRSNLPYGELHSLALSSDDKRLYEGVGSYSSYGSVTVWDTQTREELLRLSGHTSIIPGLALSDDGKRLFSGAYGDTIKVWDTKTNKETLTLPGRYSNHCLVPSRDGKRLFSTSDEGIKVWDLDAGREILTLRRPHTSAIHSLALTRDGQRLFSGSANGNMDVIDLKPGQEPFTLQGHTSRVRRLALSGDGQRLISAGESQIKMWDAKTGRNVLTLTRPSGSITSVALSGNDKRLFSSSASNSIVEWDLTDGQVIRTLEGHKDWVWAWPWTTKPNGSTQPAGTAISRRGISKQVRKFSPCATRIISRA